MDVALLSFDKPTIAQYSSLLNSASVQKHLPLSEASYSEEWISRWIEYKSQIWGDSRKGPWSVWIAGSFAGWAGVEPSEKELSFGIVLLKSYWGQGARVAETAFAKIQSEFPEAQSVIVEFPASRKSERYAERLGLHKIGSVEIAGHQFVTFRKALE